MSLKALHIFLITLSLALMAFILAWAERKIAAGTAEWGTGTMALVSLALGLAYIRWFLKNYKNLK